MREYRNIVILFLLLAMIVTMLTVIVSANGSQPTVGARASALYEPTSGEFIFGTNLDERLPMASTTKIMTALLAIELCDPDEIVSVPAEAVGVEGSSIYLKEGDLISVRDLIYSVLLQSANDGATVLALKISGDISSFAELMNERAAELGLLNTHFENPHGLDSDEHYTTARDLAILAGAALSNDTFRKICSSYKHSFTLSDGIRTVVNHNKLLKRYEGAIGVKTGFTKKSGRCLVSAAERDGLTLIAVTLDDPDDWGDHTEMLDFGFSVMEAVSITSLAPSEFQVKVLGSEQDSVRAVIDENYPYILKRKADPSLSAEVILPKYKAAPIEEGEKLGEIIIKQNGKTVKVIDIISETGAKKSSEKKHFLWF